MGFSQKQRFSPIKVTASPVPDLTKLAMASLTTAGVHTALNLAEAHALTLLTVKTGPGKLMILSVRLSCDYTSSSNMI